MFKHTGKTLQNIGRMLQSLALVAIIVLLVIIVIALFVSHEIKHAEYLLYSLIGFIAGLCLEGYGKIVEWHEEHKTPYHEEDENLPSSASNRKVSFAERVGWIQRVEEEETEEKPVEQQAEIETGYCKQCNHPIPENARFCPKCGAEQD